MIGVFDSGVGGLSVLSALVDVLPEVDFIYFADTAHVPYGNKPETVIRQRVIAIGDELVRRGCSLIVVACNTATVSAVRTLREHHPAVPVVGIEPGVKPAAASTLTGKIAVLATESTARSDRLARLISEHAAHVQVHVEACPGWATHVEQLDVGDTTLCEEARVRLEPLLAQGVDRVVLGCTHYSFLHHVLDPIVVGRAELVDVADAVARQARRLYSGGTGTGNIDLLASARPEQLRAALPALGLSRLTARIGSVSGVLGILGS